MPISGTSITVSGLAGLGWTVVIPQSDSNLIPCWLKCDPNLAPARLVPGFWARSASTNSCRPKTSTVCEQRVMMAKHGRLACRAPQPDIPKDLRYTLAQGCLSIVLFRLNNPGYGHLSLRMCDLVFLWLSLDQVLFPFTVELLPRLLLTELIGMSSIRCGV